MYTTEDNALISNKSSSPWRNYPQNRGKGGGINRRLGELINSSSNAEPNLARVPVRLPSRFSPKLERWLPRSLSAQQVEISS